MTALLIITLHTHTYVFMFFHFLWSHKVFDLMCFQLILSHMPLYIFFFLCVHTHTTHIEIKKTKTQTHTHTHYYTLYIYTKCEWDLPSHTSSHVNVHFVFLSIAICFGISYNLHNTIYVQHTQWYSHIMCFFTYEANSHTHTHTVTHFDVKYCLW
jgi:hypothetical protein